MKWNVINLMMGLFVAVALGLAGCGGGSGGGSGQTSTPVTKALIKGQVQKGPFINGSSITIYELDKNLVQTGKSFNTQITNSYGSFEIPDISFSTKYAELKADGYFFNEITGSNSVSPITLYALVDLSDKSTINVNILTHLEKDRVKKLFGQGMLFADAKKQAQKEILQIFGIAKTSVGLSETMDMSQNGDDNAILLAISAIILGNRSEGDFIELLANINADINANGTLAASGNGSALINGATNIHPAQIQKNLNDKYAASGVSSTVPDFSGMVSNFISTTKYVLTEFITYPTTGINGPNLLDKTRTVYPASTPLSFSAVLPVGHTLAVNVSGVDRNTWGWPTGSLVGWNNGPYVAYALTFTSTMTGTLEGQMLLDAPFSIPPFVIGGPTVITVYEDGSITPTWTKTVTTQ